MNKNKVRMVGFGVEVGVKQYDFQTFKILSFIRFI